MLTIILCLILCLVLLAYVYLTWDFKYWKKRGIVGPAPKLFVGTFPKSFGGTTGALVMEAHEEFL